MFLMNARQLCTIMIILERQTCLKRNSSRLTSHESGDRSIRGVLKESKPQQITSLRLRYEEWLVASQCLQMNLPDGPAEISISAQVFLIEPVHIIYNNLQKPRPLAEYDDSAINPGVGKWSIETSQASQRHFSYEERDPGDAKCYTPNNIS